jgi:hypothetical protein
MEAARIRHESSPSARPRPELKVVHDLSSPAAPMPEPTVSPVPPVRRPELLDTSWMVLNSNSAWRPVQWRWAKVLTLRDRPHVPLRLDEPLLKAASLFVHRLERNAARDHPRQRPLGPRDVREAYGIFAGHRSQRAILEAWLLTSLSDEDIAIKTGVPLPVVRVYEKLFFDVRDRLDSRSFVSLEVLNLHPTPGPDLANVLKAYAYRGGPVVLEYLIDLLLPKNDRLREDVPRRKADVLTELSTVSALGQWLFPVTLRTFKGFVQIVKHMESHSPDNLNQARKLNGMIKKVLRQAVKERTLQRTEVVEFLLSYK